MSSFRKMCRGIGLRKRMADLGHKCTQRAVHGGACIYSAKFWQHSSQIYRGTMRIESPDFICESYLNLSERTTMGT